jgi:hypothetical protein
LFVSVFILSSVLGWIFNFQASIKTSIYSFFSFLGIIFLLISASRLVITTERIKVFLQLNFILIIFSTIASLNVYFSFLPFKTPIMPIYGGINYGYFESGGIIGSSPFYGEHSMILSILFSIFLILGSKDIISRKLLVLGVIISFINIFMSISRSVFLLSLLGLILILLIQVKYSKIRITNQILKVVTFVILGYGLYIFVVNSRLGYVFQRIQEIEEKNATEGGISMDRIIDGSAFNRKVAFDLNYDRYRSRDSWIIGNGYGTVSLNREAYFVDPSIKRSSAHSQIFAILFVFGWIGFIAYWGLILRIIITSIRIIQHRTIGYFHKILAGFFTIAFFLFILNEVKADSLCWPTYFSVTIIWLGLAYANSNYNIPQNVHNQNFSNIKGL